LRRYAIYTSVGIEHSDAFFIVHTPYFWGVPTRLTARVAPLQARPSARCLRTRFIPLRALTGSLRIKKAIAVEAMTFLKFIKTLEI
jgi:hypothetical protein